MVARSRHMKIIILRKNYSKNIITFYKTVLQKLTSLKLKKNYQITFDDFFACVQLGHRCMYFP